MLVSPLAAAGVSAAAAPTGTAAVAGRLRISARANAEMANEAASTPKAAAEDPVVVTRSPPSTGPAKLPIWIMAADRPLPAWSESAGSSEGMIAAAAGRNNPSPAPMSAATGPRNASESCAPAAKNARNATSTHRTASAASMTARGLSRSARTPPTGMSTVRGTP